MRYRTDVDTIRAVRMLLREIRPVADIHAVSDGIFASLTGEVCKAEVPLPLPITYADPEWHREPFSRLSVRAQKSLVRGGFETTADITEEELMDVKNCGATTVTEILVWRKGIHA